MTMRSGKVPTETEKSQIFSQIEKAQAKEAEKKKRFLKAWKAGMKLVGLEYFNITMGLAELEKSTNKWDFEPNYKFIKHSLHQINARNALFLAAMYSFFDDEDGQRLLEELGSPNIVDLAAQLSKEQAEIIAELFLNYCGW